MDDFDLALAVWMIDPAAEYVPNADKTGIEREYDPSTGQQHPETGEHIQGTGIGAVGAWRGAGPRPTREQLDAAWAAYKAAHAAAPAT